MSGEQPSIPPEEYLKQHLEPEAEVKRSYRYDPPVISVGERFDSMALAESGHEVIQVEGLALDFDYEMPTQENLTARSYEIMARHDQLRRWRVISRATLRNPTTGEMLDITSLVPPDTAVLVESVPSLLSSARYRSGSGEILLRGPGLRNIEGILSVLHEIGHARQFILGEGPFTKEQLEEAAYFRSEVGTGDPIPSDILATILNEERSAWAFALQMMRAFLSNDPNSVLDKKRVQKYMHEWLTSYSDSIRKHPIEE